MDYDITEKQFWTMTIAELQRAIKSKQRILKAKEQEKAVFDYRMADLIAHSVSRIFSTSSELPNISEVYPTIFDNTIIEEQKQEQKQELSIIRFKQFANSFNNKFKKEVAKNDE